MRIRIIIKRFSCDEIIGGAEVFARRFAAKLSCLGVAVDITSAHYRPDSQREEVLEFTVDASDKRIPVKRLPHPSLRIFGTLVFNLCLFRSLLREKASYDIVYVCFASFEALTAALASRLTSKPVICKIASSGPSGDLGQIRGRWFAPLLYSALRRIDRFVALNREVAEDLQRIGVAGERIVFIPNGVDEEWFSHPSEEAKKDAKLRLGIPPECAVIIALGRLSDQKSFSTLLDALARLDRNHPPWRAFILGRGPKYNSLIREMKAYRLDENVTITVESRDVRKYLHASDIFVLPSKWEGVSNALLEAMATGLACICSDIPGNNEVIVHRENGLLFKTDHSIELASSLGLLMQNETIRAQLGSNARKAVLASYNMEAVARRYIDLFQELYGDSAGQGTQRETRWAPAKTAEDKTKKGEALCK